MIRTRAWVPRHEKLPEPPAPPVRIEADTKTIAILALMIVAMTGMICGLCYRVSDLEAQIVTMSR